jgi:glycosyltransferase involved in cell wall biosynthesis
MQENHTPAVSIIMAVYNTEFVLVKRAIESVLAQTYPDFELIIVNDGSQETLNIPLQKFIEAYPVIRYLYHPNRGFPLTLNRGIENSTGAYIAFIDSDDEYKPEHLASCLRQMDQYDLIASTTHTMVDTEDDYFVPDRFDMHKNIHVDDCIITGTLFGKAEIFKKLLFKDIYSQDYEFFERAKTMYRVKKLDLRTYIYYRNNQDSICSRLKKQQN